MAKTKNLGLYLTENEDPKFGDWRKKINGNGSGAGKSNMQLIDEAIGAINEKLDNMPTTSYSEVSNEAGGTTVTIN